MKLAFLCDNDCMHFGGLGQTVQAVKKFTSGLIPFENRDFERKAKFARVAGRSDEGASHRHAAVLHEIAGSLFEVRKACRIERKIVLK
jgi:hypothetical protein